MTNNELENLYAEQNKFSEQLKSIGYSTDVDAPNHILKQLIELSGRYGVLESIMSSLIRSNNETNNEFIRERVDFGEELTEDEYWEKVEDFCAEVGEAADSAGEVLAFEHNMSDVERKDYEKRIADFNALIEKISDKEYNGWLDWPLYQHIKLFGFSDTLHQIAYILDSDYDFTKRIIHNYENFSEEEFKEHCDNLTDELHNVACTAMEWPRIND